MVDNIGLPVSGINLTYGNPAPLAAAMLILISLSRTTRPRRTTSVPCGNGCPTSFRHVFGFLPARYRQSDLNFGVPAPIDIQVSGASR